MSDRLDTRIRSFVAELLAEPPESPPLPRPDVVVIDGGRSRRRGTMVQTPTRGQESETRRRLRGPAIAAAAFAVVILVVGAIYAGATLLGDEKTTNSRIASEGVTTTAAAEAPSTTTTTTTIDPLKTAEALVGQSARVVGGLAGSVPDMIDFDADGTYTVRDQGRVVDTGVYEADGDRLTFENDPTDEVRWTVNDTFLSNAQTCEGLVGEYTVGIDETGSFVLRVTWDECRERVTVANGLELAVVPD